ncbi:glycosyltransferase family 39 protein [Ekhidna sp.]|uniref:ArnT family glycosyltransferase n=1 Tax=Ekhidna sp. TaxID=2608089 RepID=UPI003297FB52
MESKGVSSPTRKYTFDSLLFFKIASTLMILCVLSMSLFRDFDHDEFEAVHTAWKILTGEVIYIDFFQHHHPFFYYLIIPFIKLIGEKALTLLILRLFIFSFFLGILRISYLLIKDIFDSNRIAWLAILLLVSTSMFSQKVIEIRPDVPQVFFGLLAILFYLRNFKGDSRNSLHLSAFFMAISFLFLQKTLFIIAGLGLTQLYHLYIKELSIKKLTVYWSVFILGICPYYLYLSFTDQILSYLFWNWTLNMNFAGSFSPFNTLIDSFFLNQFIWLFYFVGLVVFFRHQKTLILLSLLLLASIFLVQAPYRQYFMPFVPFMCGISAAAMLRVLNEKQTKIIVALTVLVPMIYSIRSIIVYPNKPELQKIDWVLDQTEPRDHIYDGDIYFNLYRKDIDFFWYSTDPKKGGLVTYKKLRNYDYNIYEAINKHRPKIISALFIEDMNRPGIKENYFQSEDYPDLYIRKNN